MDFKIRRIWLDELEEVTRWAIDEGWNPGKYDCKCIYNSDPNGFFIGELDGKPIGCISAVAYDETFGFIGQYLVKPKYRGEIFGFQLGIKALRYLSRRNIGLDGVAERIENYESMGFKFAYNNIRIECTPGFSKAANKNIVNASAVHFREISNYDSNFFPVRRDKFLKNWLNMPNMITLAYILSGEIAGLGAIRACQTGYKVGPLFADDEQIAYDLFVALTANIIDGPVYLNIPEVNERAFELFSPFNMRKIFQTLRMYAREIPTLPINKIYSSTSLETG